MRKFIKVFVVYLALLVLIYFIFRSWFSFGLLSGGDWVYYWSRTVLGIHGLFAWNSRNLGMGSSMLPTLWLESYFLSTIHASFVLGWSWYERIFWFWPYLVFGFASAWLLFTYIFTSKKCKLITGFLYITNTYALLLVGGGQMGIALSYSIAPFSLLALEYLLKKLSLRSALVFALVFSAVLLLDIRIGYMMIGVFFLRLLFALQDFRKEYVMRYIYLFSVSVIVVVGLHAFWLLPMYLTHGEAISEFGAIYTGAGAVKFFSFAKFEDAFGLLHPNWPENIFGLTHFMRPEFLVLPLLAYGSLLFLKPFDSLRSLREKQEQMYILFFALLGLVGAFLAKGANDPFGGLYLWMFAHIPGFIMFRDPTKWYLLIALSYSMLIPYTVSKIYTLLKDRFEN